MISKQEILKKIADFVQGNNDLTLLAIVPFAVQVPVILGFVRRIVVTKHHYIDDAAINLGLLISSYYFAFEFLVGPALRNRYLPEPTWYNLFGGIIAGVGLYFYRSKFVGSFAR